MDTLRPIDSIHMGLGPIGMRILETGVSRGVLRPRVAIDVDAAAGARLADAGFTTRVVRHVDDVGVPFEGAVALHATTSRALDVRDQILALVEREVSVVSTCEELAFPIGANVAAREAIDAAARRRNVAVIATGVNPGMVMDSLVVHLAAVATSLEHIRVERVVDTGTRRGPLRRKTGVGLDAAGFAAAVSARQVGHVGLWESCAMIAEAVGWEVERIDDSIVPVLDAGAVIGLHQQVRGIVLGEGRIELDLRMVDGAADPGDRIVLEGTPPLDVRIVGGIAGDEATVGAVLNQAMRVRRLPPGFHTLIDLPDAGALAAGYLRPVMATAALSLPS